jgi:hypothetical protein
MKSEEIKWKLPLFRCININKVVGQKLENIQPKSTTGVGTWP